MVVDTPSPRRPPPYSTLQREREQDDRIRSLLAEMRPQRSGTLRVSVDEPNGSLQTTPVGSVRSLSLKVSAPFDQAPPTYREWQTPPPSERPRSQLTNPDSWMIANQQKTSSVRHSPGWSRNPRPLSAAPHSPAARFLCLQNSQEAALPPPPVLRLAESPVFRTRQAHNEEVDTRRFACPNLEKINGNNALPQATTTHKPRPVSVRSQTQPQPLLVHREYLNASDDDTVPRRNSPFERGTGRQASFMAAVAGTGGGRESARKEEGAEMERKVSTPNAPSVYRRGSLRAALGEMDTQQIDATNRYQKSISIDNPQDSSRSTQSGSVTSSVENHLESEETEKSAKVVMRSPIVHARRREHRGRRATHIGSPTPASPPMNETEHVNGTSSSPTTVGSSSSTMRRQRPKSYVLATSSSYPLSSEDHEESSDAGRSPASFPSCDSLDRRVPKSGAPHPPATHRITRFIQLFSHHDTQKTNASGVAPANSTSRRHAPLKRSRTAGPTGRVPLPPPTPVPAHLVTKQGLLLHQEHAMGTSSKKHRVAHWDQRWALLAGRTLYMCKQLSSYVSDTTKEKMYSVPCDAVTIDVESAIVDIAYEALKLDDGAKHVVRVVTQQHREHLLQTHSENEMLAWIGAIQRAATLDNDPLRPLVTSAHATQSEQSLASSCSDPALRNASTITTTVNPTTQLIMHRYKAKSNQLGSPLAGKRASGPLSADGHCVQPGTSSEPPSTGSSNGQCDNSTTPKTGRKWKKPKVGKQGSGSSGSSAPSQEKDKPNCALGNKITDCTTSGEGDLVPLLVQLCVKVVEAHGLDTVGIYRIPGNTAAVNALKETLGQGLDTLDFNDSRWKDVNVVSSLLKMFLRKLPEPLLTDKLYPFFIDANRIAHHHQRLHKLRNLLRKLPRAHYDTLKFLVGHLKSVTSHSSINKMECRNLALMFGPSIVRPSDDNMATMVTHMSDQCKIIETFINYYTWIFNDEGTAEDAVPEQIASEALAPPGGGMSLDTAPPGVSSASFNDMHNLIRRVNEEQAADMMREGGNRAKIKNILNVRRNSRRDKSKSKLKIESTAACAMNPLPSANQSSPRGIATSTQSSVDSAFCGVYQERDIDAEIASRQTSSPPASAPASMVEHSPSLESSLGSLPDTSRTAPELARESMTVEEVAEVRRKRQENLFSARRIFIAGSEAAAQKAAEDRTSIDAMVSHTQHLNMADSPALEVLSEATREKIRRLQQSGGNWTSLDRNNHSVERREKERDVVLNDRTSPRDPAKHSPTRDDAMSFTSDYSTTSSLPVTLAMTVSVCDPLATTSSDYASSDVSPCARQASASPCPRPRQLPLSETRCEQKIRMRNKASSKDPRRRHTLTDMDTLREGSTMGKLARWLGLRKSSPDVRDEAAPSAVPAFEPPSIVRTSPNELTPASGDEQL